MAKLEAMKEATKVTLDRHDQSGIDGQVFKGKRYQCRSQTGGAAGAMGGGYNNCPGGSSKDPNTEEQNLKALVAKGKCIRIGSYNQGSNIGTMTGSKRQITAYCCYETILATQVQLATQNSEANTLGDSAQSIQCRGINIHQMDKIPWQSVNFGPVIEEMKAKIQEQGSTQQLQEKAENNVRRQLNYATGPS
jgi:hypothetical protein